MGKRKIGKIYRKPIVIGNPNLISKNEVNVDSLSSGEGGGGGSNYEYFLSEDIQELAGFASVVKLYNEEENYMRIIPASAWATTEIDKSILVAVGLDLQSEYIGPEPFNGKLLDIFMKMGLTKEAIDAFPRITESEFYTIETA